jgi:hypothetical protein
MSATLHSRALSFVSSLNIPESTILARCGLGSHEFCVCYSRLGGEHLSPRYDIHFVRYSFCVSRHFWNLLVYYKLNDVLRASDYVPGWHLSRLRKTETYLANRLNSIPKWDVRLEADNRLPHVFPAVCTGIVDTLPIYINRPSGDWQSATYNGKFKCHILKVNVCYFHWRFDRFK